MIFEYVFADKNNPFIEAFYFMKIESKDLPFSYVVIPNGTSHIRKIFSEKVSKVDINKQSYELNGLTVNGPIYGAYPIDLNTELYGIGIALKPGALYEITEKDVYSVYNKVEKLENFCSELHTILNPIFDEFTYDFDGFKKAINQAFTAVRKKEDDRISEINQTIAMIKKNEGLIKIEDIIDDIPVSRKTLENQFKKMVGITIGRYIRQHRFLSLISKYKKEEIDYYEMMYKYNFYDASHFIKDIQFFTLQSPKEYFKKDYPLVKKYLFK